MHVVYLMSEARKIGYHFKDSAIDEVRKSYSELEKLLLKKQAEVIIKEQEARHQLDEQTPSGPGDVADESVIDANADYFSNLANAQRKELIEINSALDRMHRGIYGICESCEEPIALDRLRQLPNARLCLDCQATAERRNKVKRNNYISKV